ncbi:MAG: hypothetical protein JJU36_16220 [Phycisphaeraceae bacterium]|nr:hypothetical protein [Phycisphaeraceae bacterium]
MVHPRNRTEWRPRWVRPALAAALLAGWLLLAPSAPQARSGEPITVDITAVGVSAAPGRTEPEAPIASGLPPRLIRHFDFEEPNNAEMMPRDWYAIGRPEDTADPSFARVPVHRQFVTRTGYPAFNTVGFNKSQLEPGDHNLHLRTEAGSVGAFLAMGSVIALPNTDYLITARVKTSGLRHARARLSAGLVDQEGNWLEDAIIHGPGVRGDGRDWEDVQLRIHGRSGEAAWMILWVELLQPRQRHDDQRRNEHQVLLQDIGAEAWFDDISVWQIPRIILRTQNPVNIIRAPDRPVIHCDIRDHADQRVTARIRIYDEYLHLIDEDRRTVGRDVSRIWRWNPNLPRYGWYLADLELHAEGRPEHQIGRSLLALLWLPQTAERPDLHTPAFTLDLSDIADEHIALMPALLGQTALRNAAMSIWTRRTEPADIDRRQSDLGGAHNELGLRVGDMIMSFWPLPEYFERRTTPIDSSLDALAGHAAISDPMIRPVLRYWGQRIRRWQLGDVPGNAIPFEPNLRERLERSHRNLRMLAPDAGMLLPWGVQHPAPRLTIPNLRLALEVPVTVPPATIPELVDRIRRDSADTRHAPKIESLHLFSPSAREISQHRRITDMILRIVHASSADVPELVLRQIWTPASDRDAGMMPDPLLGVFAQAAGMLAGQRLVGHMPVMPGVTCLIMNGARGPMLVVWNERSDVKNPVLDLDLGGDAKAWDVWGNPVPLGREHGRDQLALDDRPVFVTGIDLNLALLRRSFVMDKPKIRSNQLPQTRYLTLGNPWPRTIHGTVRIIEPEGWNIVPMRRSVAIPAGQTITFPLVMQMFPRLEAAGRHRLTVRLQTPGEPQLSVDLHVDFEVGLDEVELDSALTIEPSRIRGRPADAVVVQRLTNRTDRPISIRAFANLRGHPTRETPVPQLMPGQSLVIRLRFPGGGPDAVEHSVRTGIEVTPGNDILIHRLHVDLDE